MRNIVLTDGGLLERAFPRFYINTLQMIILIISRYEENQQKLSIC